MYTKTKKQNKIKELFIDSKMLLRNIPSPLVAFFVIAVVTMNLLANKSIDLNVSFLALDAGIIVSWIVFLSMDIVTKHFGPKEATILSLFGLLCNLFIALLFFLGSIIPGTWGESFDTIYPDAINNALNNTISGTWYILLGSSIAFITSAFVNNNINYLLGKIFIKNPDGIKAYVVRTYISTMIGQFVDNLVFSLIVSRIFFGWTITQCLTCSVMGMLFELICEIIFSPIGYRITRRWKEQNVGSEYIIYRNMKKGIDNNESINNRNI